MAAPRKALGRGFSAMLGGAAPSTPPAAAPASSARPTEPARLPLDRIDPSPWQPRKAFDEERLLELEESLRTQGMIQPLVVRRRGERYELIAGERRWRAATRLGWTEAPGVVLEAADARMRELALVENLQRDDLNSIEEAAAFDQLRKDTGATHEELAARIGKSRAFVTNSLRLLDLSEEVKRLVAGKSLSAGHARALLGLTDPQEQARFGAKASEEGWSVRETEKRVAARARPTKKADAAPTPPADPEARALKARLEARFATEVAIEDRGGKGWISIRFYSYDDVTRILEKMGE